MNSIYLVLVPKRFSGHESGSNLHLPTIVGFWHYSALSLVYSQNTIAVDSRVLEASLPTLQLEDVMAKQR